MVLCHIQLELSGPILTILKFGGIEFLSGVYPHTTVLYFISFLFLPNTYLIIDEYPKYAKNS